MNEEGYLIKTNIGSYVITYEYLNGYLQKEEAVGGRFGRSFTWENDNLISMIEYWDDGDIFTTTYSYGTAPNKESNVAPWSPPAIDEPGFYLALPSNWFGKTSKNLVSSDIGETSYRYETNANGYVTKVYSTRNGTESLKFEVQYK